MPRRIRTNTTYVYNPVPLDRCNPPYGAQTGILVPGSLVRAVRLPGCPSPNTMGHTHIALHPSGAFAGLVCTNSLLTPKEFAALPSPPPTLPTHKETPMRTRPYVCRIVRAYNTPRESLVSVGIEQARSRSEVFTKVAPFSNYVNRLTRKDPQSGMTIIVRTLEHDRYLHPRTYA